MHGCCVLLQVPEQLPENDYYEYYEPDFSLNVHGGWLLLGFAEGLVAVPQTCCFMLCIAQARRVLQPCPVPLLHTIQKSTNALLDLALFWHNRAVKMVSCI